MENGAFYYIKGHLYYVKFAIMTSQKYGVGGIFGGLATWGWVNGKMTQLKDDLYSLLRCVLASKFMFCLEGIECLGNWWLQEQKMHLLTTPYLYFIFVDWRSANPNTCPKINFERILEEFASRDGVSGSDRFPQSFWNASRNTEAVFASHQHSQRNGNGWVVSQHFLDPLNKK